MSGRDQLYRVVLGFLALLALSLCLMTPILLVAFSLRAPWSGALGMTLRSLGMALAAALPATALAALFVLATHRRLPVRMHAMLRWVQTIFSGLRGLIYAVALLILLPGEHSPARLWLALLLSTLPLAVQALSAAADTMPHSLQEAEVAMGASPLRLMPEATLPGTCKTLLTTLLYTLVRALSLSTLYLCLAPDPYAFLSTSAVVAPLGVDAAPSALILCALCIALFSLAHYLRNRR